MPKDSTKLACDKGKKYHPAWNKGLTKDDPRVERQGCWKRGDKHREIAVRNLGRFATKGNSAWNKGLTKENHAGIARGAEKVRQHNLGKHLSEETKQKQRGKRGPYRETGKRKESQDRFWANISAELKSEYVRRSRLKTSKKKTSPEIILEDLLNTHFPGEWKYVGQGELIIAGLIPDFTNINGRKAVIEAYGDYWHKGENPQDRIDKYSKFGYMCVILWESEIKRTPMLAVDRIKNIIYGR